MAFLDPEPNPRAPGSFVAKPDSGGKLTAHQAGAAAAWVLRSMPAEQKQAMKNAVLTMVLRDGASQKEAARKFGLDKGTVGHWCRTAKWEEVNADQIEEIRLNQAAELEAMRRATWDRLEQTGPDGAGEPLDTDGYVKLMTVLRGIQERESKLLGLDAPTRVEHAGRIKIDHDPELEQLVAELAGGGMLLSGPDEVLDAEVVDQ